MILPPPCVSVEVGTPPAALYSVASLEERCDAVLGKGRCRVVGTGTTGIEPRPTCWNVTVTSTGAEPVAATVVLHAPGQRDYKRIQHTVEFRPHDAPADRWATLGLLIAALVTIEQHAATSSEGTSVEGTLPPPVPAPVPSAAADTTISRISAPPTAEASTASLEWDVRASGLFGVGLVPGFGWGARFETSLGREHIGATARVSYLAQQSQTIVGTSLGGNFQLVGAGAGVCWLDGATKAVAAVRMCAGGDVNVTLARGFGVAEPQNVSAVSGAAWVGASAVFRLAAHLALTAGVEGAAGLFRPRFEIEGAANVYSPSPIAGYASLGLAVPF